MLTVDIHGNDLGDYILDLPFDINHHERMSTSQKYKYTKGHASLLWQSSRIITSDSSVPALNNTLLCGIISSLHEAACGNKTKSAISKVMVPIMVEDVKMKLEYSRPAALAQALAPFTLDYSLPKFRTEFNLNVTKHQWANARFHAAVWGVGTTAPHQSFSRIRIKKEHFASATRFILDEGNIYQLAYGTSKLELSDGTVLELPACARDEFISAMYTDYRKRHTDANGKCTGALSRSSFYHYTKLAAEKNPKALAALDPTAIRHGKDAFSGLRSELEVVARYSPLARLRTAALLSDIDTAESHIKLLKQHLHSSSAAMKPGAFAQKKAHCTKCAFGDISSEDPSRPVPCTAQAHATLHGGSAHCRQCVALELLRDNFAVLIEDAKRKQPPGDKTKSKLIHESEVILNRIFERLFHYERHEFRAAHEAGTTSQLLAKLDSRGALITMDWKMKFLVCPFFSLTPLAPIWN